MGYQESLLFCQTKRDLINLCRVLNKAQPVLYEDYDVFPAFVGKYKGPLHATFPWTEEVHWTKSTPGYYVWWGGERHPIQSGDWLEEFMTEHFGPDYALFYCVFCEYIDEADNEMLLDGIDLKEHNVVQSNAMGKVIVVHQDRPMDLSIVQQL